MEFLLFASELSDYVDCILLSREVNLHNHGPHGNDARVENHSTMNEQLQTFIVEFCKVFHKAGDQCLGSVATGA